MTKGILILISFLLCLGCSSSGTKVVKPRYHKVWARGNKYLIDVPVGSRHVHMFERKRTKTVRMK